MLRKLTSNNTRSWASKFAKIYATPHSSLEYANQMFKAWQENPSSVHESWQEYFKNNKEIKKSKI